MSRVSLLLQPSCPGLSAQGWNEGGGFVQMRDTVSAPDTRHTGNGRLRHRRVHSSSPLPRPRQSPVQVFLPRRNPSQSASLG